jgi:dienelactone hydrolase
MMFRPSTAGVIAWIFVLASNSSLLAQERISPREAKGGAKQGEPWALVPETFHDLRKVPEWTLPSDLRQWQELDRVKVRATLLQCLGEMPPRPDPQVVKVVATEDHGDFTLERFQFHNGVDMVVPGVILIPKSRQGRAPAIIGLHGHGSVSSNGKDVVATNPNSGQLIGPSLVRKGYIVAAIDGYFHGERIGKGPGGDRDNKDAQEATLFKLYLWQGRTLWGMMLRDQQCLIDYLQTRPEVDKERIGATGMSMGCTGSWWLAAIDERVKAVVGVCCFTRFTELLAHGNLRAHGIYYFVPGLLRHFDSEAIYSLIAPRPMLMLSGDQDGGAPTDGIATLERKLSAVYRLYGKPKNFHSVIYKDTGHEYLPEMKDEMVKWFERHLPVSK